MGLPDHLKEVTLADAPDSLSHYGVKGQKWGVRKAGSGKIRPRSTMARRDRKEQRWAETAQTDAYNKVYQRAASKIRRGTRQINRKPEYKGQSFRRDTPLRRKYYDEYSKMVSAQLNAASAKHGISPKKRYQLHFELDINKDATPNVTIRRTEGIIGRMHQRDAARETRKLPNPKKVAPEVKHAEASEPDEVEVKLTFDDEGFILDMDLPSVSHDEELEAEDFFEHYDFDQVEFAHFLGEDDLDDFLTHFGVKGMKWGVRKKSKTAKVKVTNSESGRSAEISYNPRKTTVNAQTGEISTSSKKELKSIRGQVKKNQLKLMSDDELKGRINRLKMEQEFSKLSANSDSPGKKLVKKVLKDSGDQLAKALVEQVIVPNVTSRVGSLGKQAALVRAAQQAARNGS